jgi:hypothetical protein
MFGKPLMDTFKNAAVHLGQQSEISKPEIAESLVGTRRVKAILYYSGIKIELSLAYCMCKRAACMLCPLKDRQCTYKRSIETRSRNRCCRRKARSTTYSECVSVALVIQHAKRMRRIILPSVACLALQNFSTLTDKRHDYGDKNSWT